MAAFRRPSRIEAFSGSDMTLLCVSFRITNGIRLRPLGSSPPVSLDSILYLDDGLQANVVRVSLIAVDGLFDMSVFRETRVIAVEAQVQ